ncbi:MAG: SDR family NAD(P)-dependent oxidoreductase [Deltaproteobacteria bacterium]|nr:SDR family NAD(P)-dependent oxidoreductase [Deltaproteobacteria bacterium]
MKEPYFAGRCSDGPAGKSRSGNGIEFGHRAGNGDGAIVNVASGLGKDVYPDYSPYCGTKCCVRGFTKAMARELPNRVGIYFANPGLTATRMTGYQGADPASVAGIIVKAAEEKLGKRSGDDIDIWEYLDESP